MRQRALAVALTIVALATATAVPAIGQAMVRVFVDGEPVFFDQPPVIQGSRVLVPLRGIFEKMGAAVEWHAATRAVVAARGSTLVELQIGSRIARVDGRPVTLDVPAMIIGGRTLVPLRFISESLGARVDWNAATRTVVITSGGVALPPPQPPAAPPPRQQVATRGVITSVVLAQSPQDQPRITVEAGNIATTIRITTDTAITRVESSSGAGGSVGVAALRPGDDAEVTLAGDVATRIRATYTMTTGRIEAIASASRTLVLTDGRAVRYVPAVTVLVNNQAQAGGVAVLRSGQIAELRLNPTTREAWEVNVISGAAGTGQLGQMALVVNQPRQGQTVASPIRVAGVTAPNATVTVAVSWFLGIPVGSAAVTANAEGRFRLDVPVTIIQPNSIYLITVTATHQTLGTEQRQFTVIVSPEARR